MINFRRSLLLECVLRYVGDVMELMVDYLGLRTSMTGGSNP